MLMSIPAESSFEYSVRSWRATRQLGTQKTLGHLALGGHSKGIWTLWHLRHSGTRALRALGHLGTWALRALRHLGTHALEHLGQLGTWALGYSRHLDTRELGTRGTLFGSLQTIFLTRNVEGGLISSSVNRMKVKFLTKTQPYVKKRLLAYITWSVT